MGWYPGWIRYRAPYCARRCKIKRNFLLVYNVKVSNLFQAWRWERMEKLKVVCQRVLSVRKWGARVRRPEKVFLNHKLHLFYPNSNCLGPKSCKMSRIWQMYPCKYICSLEYFFLENTQFGWIKHFWGKIFTASGQYFKKLIWFHSCQNLSSKITLCC